MAEWKHWQLWREVCALARCTDEARHDLQGFAFNRFTRYLQKSRPSATASSAADAWHAFESYLVLGHSRTAKAWKQWLFTRGGKNPTRDCVQGGATLIMRDVVREYLRREHAPVWMTSLDAPIAGQQNAEATNTLCAADLLPDPTDPLATMESNELDTLARQLWGDAGQILSFRHMLALTVHQSGKALYHPVVLSAADCGKSSLCNALHQAFQLLANCTNNAFPAECAQVRMQLTSLLIDHIVTRAKESLEIEHPQLFRYLEEDA